MTKVNLSDVSNLLGSPTSAANTINANNEIIVSAFDNTLSRDGSVPNQMNSDIDMNHNDIYNVDNLFADVLVLNGVTVQPSGLVQVEIPDNSIKDVKIYTPSTPSEGIDSAKLKFIQSAATAQVRILQDKVRERLSIMDFIPVSLHAGIYARTDTTDLTTYFNNAAASGPDRTIYIPRGKFNVVGPINILLDGVTFEGESQDSLGNGGSNINSTSTTASVFQVGDGLVIQPRKSFAAKKLVFTTSVTKTTGAYISSLHTYWMNIFECSFLGGVYHLDFQNAQCPLVWRCEFRNIANTSGVAIRAQDTNTANQSGAELRIDECFFQQDGTTWARANIEVGKWDGLWLDNLSCNVAATCLLVNPPTGQACVHIFAQNCSFDGARDYALTTAASVGVAQRLWFTSCWFGSSGVGTFLNGAADGVSFVACKFCFNKTNGLQIASAANVIVDGCQVSGNSTSSIGTYDGIVVNGSITNNSITITNTKSKQMGGFGNTQRYGLQLGSGCDFITILACDFNSNVTGSVLDNTASATFLRFRDNVALADRDQRGGYRGTYSPNNAGITNVTSTTPYTASWLRVDDMVTVFGRVDVVPTAAALMSIGVSLPIPSAFTANEDCVGTAAFDGNSNAGRIYADVGNGRARIGIAAPGTSSVGVAYNFSYRIR